MQPSTCPIEMSDVLPCGRPIHAALAGCDEQLVCLMHSRDLNKSQDEFSREIKAIMAGSSNHHRPQDRFAFCGFAFLVADFRKATFAKDVDFSPEGIRQRSEAGYRHTLETLSKAPWRGDFDPGIGFILHEAMGGEPVHTPAAT